MVRLSRVIFVAALAITCVLGTGVEAFATEATSCERQAKPLSKWGQKYVSLLKAAVKEHEVDEENLRWLVAQQVPQMPVQNQRELGNHSFRVGFERLLRHLQKEEWPLIVPQIENLLRRIANDRDLVADAKEKTRGYFNFKVTKYESSTDFDPLPLLVTSKGEVFIAESSGDNIVIRELHSDHRATVKATGSLSQNAEFFERTNGDILFAAAFGHEVRVANARTGDDILKFPLEKIKSLSDLPENYRYFRPFLAEVDGELKVAVVYRGEWPNQDLDGKPAATIDVATEKFSEWELPNGTAMLQRTADGKVYAYGSVPFGKTRRIFAINIISGIAEFGGQLKSTGIKVDMLLPGLYFENGKPRVYYSARTQTPPQLFDPQSGHLAAIPTVTGHSPTGEPILGSLPTYEIGIVNIFNSMYGEPWIVNVGLINDKYEIEYGPLNDPTRRTKAAPPELLPNRSFNKVHAVQSPIGQLIVLEEFNIDGEPTQYHVLEPKTHSWISLPIPSGSESLEPPFYNPVKRTVNVLMKYGPQLRWRLMQLYGP